MEGLIRWRLCHTRLWLCQLRMLLFCLLNLRRWFLVPCLFERIEEHFFHVLFAVSGRGLFGSLLFELGLLEDSFVFLFKLCSIIDLIGFSFDSKNVLFFLDEGSGVNHTGVLLLGDEFLRGDSLYVPAFGDFERNVVIVIGLMFFGFLWFVKQFHFFFYFFLESGTWIFKCSQCKCFGSLIRLLNSILEHSRFL